MSEVRIPIRAYYNALFLLIEFSRRHQNNVYTPYQVFKNKASIKDTVIVEYQ